ncbi:MAG: hypothetical protein V5789_01395 [Colwellia sp.]
MSNRLDIANEIIRQNITTITNDIICQLELLAINVNSAGNYWEVICEQSQNGRFFTCESNMDMLDKLVLQTIDQLDNKMLINIWLNTDIGMGYSIDDFAEVKYCDEYDTYDIVNYISRIIRNKACDWPLELDHSYISFKELMSKLMTGCAIFFDNDYYV